MTSNEAEEVLKEIKSVLEYNYQRQLRATNNDAYALNRDPRAIRNTITESYNRMLEALDSWFRGSL